MQAYLKLFYSLSILFFLASCQSSEDSTNSHPKNTTTLAPLSPFDNNTIDGLLVSVADQAILLSDFQHAILASSNGQTQILASGKLIGGTMTASQANQVLESLINQKVLQIKAQELGIDIGEDELSGRINDFLKQQNYTEFDLQEQLKKTGKTMDEYRHEFKNEVLKQELIGRVISPLVTVTDDEVNSFYLQQTGSIKQVTAVKLRSLMLNLPTNYSGDPLKFDPVIQIQKALSEGKDFSDLVKTYSMASNVAQTGGVLPSRSVNELPPELRQKLTHLKINDVVGPFHIGSSLFFFQYLGAEFGSGSDLKANYTSWKNKLSNIKFEERLTEYLKNERAILRVNLRPFTITR